MASLSSLISSVGVKEEQIQYPASNLSFRSIESVGEAQWIVIKDLFERVVKPLHDYPDTFLSRLRANLDYEARVLYPNPESQSPIGIIVYKKTLSDHLALYGVKQGLEIVIFSLFNPKETPYRTFGAQLLSPAVEMAKTMKAHSLFFSLRDTHRTMANFLEGNDFQRIRSFPDRYQVGLREGLWNLTIRSAQSLLEEERKAKEEIAKRAEKRKLEGAARPGTKAPTEIEPIRLKPQYVHQIQNGIKTIEGRINSGSFARLKAGQRVRFYYDEHSSDDVTCTIVSKVHYASFREMLQEVGYENCIPAAGSIDEAVNVYHEIDGYEARAKSRGVLALYLERATR